jgi:hypothetical protein
MAPTLTRYILLILKLVLEQGYTNFPKIQKPPQLVAGRLIWGKFRIENPKQLDGTVLNLGATEPWRPLFVHPCLGEMLYKNVNSIRCLREDTIAWCCVDGGQISRSAKARIFDKFSSHQWRYFLCLCVNWTTTTLSNSGFATYSDMICYRSWKQIIS